MGRPAAAARIGAIVDVVVVGGVALVVKAIFDEILWKFAGPISLTAAVAVATLLIHLRGVSWADYGMGAPKGVKGALWLAPQTLLAIVALFAASLFAFFALGPFLDRPPTEEERFEGIAGNLPYFLLWLSLAIVHGGFFEEMVNRGFFITRLETALGAVNYAPYIAVVIQAVFFGSRHYYYQGVYGAVATGLIGLFFGLLFLAYKRNLWPLIVAHGAVDSLVFVSYYTGWDIG